MSALEQIIRPFADQNVTPTPFTKPGENAVPMVHVRIGFQGTLKTVSYSLSASSTTFMGQQHKEKKVASPALTAAMRKAAQPGGGS